MNVSKTTTQENDRYLYKKLFQALLTTILCVLSLPPLWAQHASISERVTNWKEDLEFLKKEFENQHYDLFRIMSEKEWEKGFDQLIKKIPELEDHEVITETMKIVSKIGDGHTSIYVPFHGKYQFHQIPIAFQLFDDGLFIKGAAPEYKALVGKKVIAIGEQPVKQVLKRLKTITPIDNDQWLKVLGVEVYMTIPEILYSLGLTDDISMVSLELQDTHGQVSSENIKADPFDISSTRFVDVRPGWVTAHDKSDSPLPLYLKRINSFPNDFYWSEYLEEKSLVYSQINVLADNPEKSFASYCEEVFKFIEANDVEKLVIDIRLNSGGNNQLFEPLIYKILNSSRINKKANLFVIIGRRTYSAAMNLATNLEQRTNATFIGECTGSSPNFVGEDNRIVLPNSGLFASASNKYWQDSTPDDKRSCIKPEHFNVLSFSQYENNLDPSLEKVFELINQKNK